MTDPQYRRFLDLLMCCDPWPVDPAGDTQPILEALADDEAGRRGYHGWIEAYHHFRPDED